MINNKPIKYTKEEIDIVNKILYKFKKFKEDNDGEIICIKDFNFYSNNGYNWLSLKELVSNYEYEIFKRWIKDDET